MRVDLGETADFMSYTGDLELYISDLNSRSITIGKEYMIQVSATDGKDTVVHDLIFVVLDAGTAQAQVVIDTIAQEASVESAESEPTSSSDETGQTKATRSKRTELQVEVDDWRATMIEMEQFLWESSLIFMKKPPRPRIASVDQSGEIKLTFDQDMQLVPLLKMLEEGTVEYEGLTYPVLDV